MKKKKNLITPSNCREKKSYLKFLVLSEGANSQSFPWSKAKKGGMGDGAIPPCHPQPRAFGKLALRFASHSTFRRQTIRLPMLVCVLNFASCFAVTRSMAFDHGIFFLVSRC